MLMNNSKKLKSKPKLMMHVVLGFPSLNESIEIAKTLARSGSAILELQIPFTDPIADGPTIMNACEVALKNGTTIKKCFEAINVIKQDLLNENIDIPIVIMSYYNPVFKFKYGKLTGIEAFSKQASNCGVDGLIIPDIPADNASEDYWTIPLKYGVIPIPLVTPVTDLKRLKLISKIANKEAFIYCVSSTGTTGAKKQLPSDLKKYIQNVKKYFKQPLAIGFGISTKDQVNSLKGLADFAVVGSATINLISQHKGKSLHNKINSFVKELSS